MASDLLDLRSKIAAISGGASGIGWATAQLLAEHGAAVALLDVNEDNGARAGAQLGQRGLFVDCDVTSAGAGEGAGGAIREGFGRLDILFNNAGGIRRKTVV